MERNGFDPPHRKDDVEEDLHRAGRSYWAIAVLAAIAGVLIVVVAV